MTHRLRDPSRRLTAMSDGEFLAAWKRAFGQAPAAILERPAMVRLLLADGADQIRLKRAALERLRAITEAAREGDREREGERR